MRESEDLFQKYIHNRYYIELNQCMQVSTRCVYTGVYVCICIYTGRIIYVPRDKNVCIYVYIYTWMLEV